jgi:hypothetical protein
LTDPIFCINLAGALHPPRKMFHKKIART